MRASRMKKAFGAILAWDFARLPLIIIAGALIAVSGLFSVSFAHSVGKPSGFELVFVLFGLAVDGYAAFALPVLWPRLVSFGRLLMICFLLPCLAYKLTAAHRFAAENLTKREASQDYAAASFQRAEARVDDLRGRMKAYADARPAPIVEAEIDGLLRDPATEGCTGAWNGPTTKRVCPTVDKLRAELASAKTFARLKGELQTALAALDGKAPVATVADAATGPVPWLLGLFGFAPGSFVAFVSMLVMIIVEGGSVAVPALVGFARRPTAQPAETPARTAPAPAQPDSEAEAPKSGASEPTDAAKAAIAELTRFLGERTERAAGEKVQSTPLYSAYMGWKQGSGGDPMTVHLFGKTLTDHLGLTKVKRGGVNWYMNIQLKAPKSGGKSASHLQVVDRQAS